jgi:hypothetical protein
MDYGKLTLDEIKRGYRRDEGKAAYICLHCEKAFALGQVFKIDERFYTPEHAAAKHIDVEHGGQFERLLHADTKYNNLTENQKELLSYFYKGLPDGEIARSLDVSPSTVRHQKFTFREKAKQAKLYLAIFEYVFGEADAKSAAAMAAQPGGGHGDGGDTAAERERARVLRNAFESFAPLRLKAYPTKEKRKIMVLGKIACEFERGREYTEGEVNRIIEPVYADYAIIRRGLIVYGLMGRTNDGSRYWLI